MEPDALIVQDVTLIHQVDLFAGLAPEGYVLVNTSQPFDELGLGSSVQPVPARSALHLPGHRARARAHTGRPLPNAALLGGFAALTGQITLDGVEQALRQRFAGPTGERNVAAADAAYRHVTRPSRTAPSQPTRPTRAHAATD